MLTGFKKYSHVLLAATVSLIWLMVCLAMQIISEANDDLGIALMIYMNPERLSIFAHPMYSKFLGFFFERIPRINWWTIFSFIGMTTAVFAFNCILLQRYKGFKKWIPVIAVMYLFYLAGGHLYNFTRTGGLISLAGGILAVESVCIPMKRWHNRILCKACAVLMMCWGSAIRMQSFYLCIPFFLGYFVSKILCRKDFKEQLRFYWKLWLRKAAIVVMMLALTHIYVSGGQRWLRSDPAWDEYIRFNTARATISDYDGLPGYSENQEAYEAIGVSAIDLDMLENWVSENTESLTTEKVMAVAALSKVQIGWKSALQNLMDCAKTSATFRVGMIIVACSLLFGNKKDYLYILCMTAGAFLICLYFAKKGRIPNRVFDVICVSAAVSLLFGCSFQGEKKSSRMSNWLKQNAALYSVLNMVVPAILLLVALCFVGTKFSNFGTYWQYENYMTKRIDQMDEQSDRIYVLPTISHLVDRAYAYGLWHLPAAESGRNTMYLGGWIAKDPYNVQIREELGVYNPFAALVNNPDVYSCYSEQVHRWLCDYYENDITVCVVDELDGIEIIQYSKVIEAEKNGVAKQCSMTIEETTEEYVKIDIQADMVSIAQYDDVRLNVHTMEGLRTFRLEKHENGFAAKIYGDYITPMMEAYLIAKNDNGGYSVIGDLGVGI